MPLSDKLGFPLAVTTLLLVLACSYELAVHWTFPRALSATERKGVPDSVKQPEADHAVLPVPEGDGGFILPEAPPAASPERDPREVLEYGSPLARRLRLLHRYVGTVGGEPATALLDWQNPDSVSGSFYWQRRGPLYFLAPPSARPRHRRGAVLPVHEGVNWDESGSWQLHGPPGSLLTGTWRSGPTGQPVPFVLRESYVGAVRLAVRTEWRHGHTTPADRYGYDHTSVAWVKYEFLQLLNPAAVPAALRPLLAPGPTGRRHRLRTSGDFDCATSYEVRVALNEGGLLGYQYAEECSPLGGNYSLTYHNALLDLAWGRWLAPESQFVPHYELALARLLARRLLHEPAYRPLTRAITRDSSWQRQALPSLSVRADTLATLTH